MPDLNINNFHRGQTSSPYLSDGAFSKSQNLDIFSQKGIARINYLPTAGASDPTDLIRWLTRASNSATTFYGADDSSKAYVIDPTVATHTVTAKGTSGKYVFHWKGYLLSISGANLKYNSTGTTWVNLDGNPTISNSPDALFVLESVQDGKIYIATGNNINILYETGADDFDPTDATSFNDNNWAGTSDAFSLPEGYKATGLAELGIWIISEIFFYQQ